MDEDGKLVMPSIDIPLEILLPEDSIFLSRNFIVNIQQMKFAKPGFYAINITLDGGQAGSIPLLVRKMTNKPA